MNHETISRTLTVTTVILLEWGHTYIFKHILDRSCHVSDLPLFSVSICCCCFFLLMQLSTLTLKASQWFCGHDLFPSMAYIVKFSSVGSFEHHLQHLRRNLEQQKVNNSELTMQVVINNNTEFIFPLFPPSVWTHHFPDISWDLAIIW